MQHYFEFITDDMISSATALAGGGAGAMMGSCGAFSGGLMALSARFCPRSEEPSDEELAELEKARPRFYEFRDWFIAEFGGVSCSDVLQKLAERSYNLKNDQERDEFHDWFSEQFGGVTYSDMLQRLAERSYDLSSDQKRDEFRKLQRALGFNCGPVIEKAAIRIAGMLAGELNS